MDILVEKIKKLDDIIKLDKQYIILHPFTSKFTNDYISWANGLNEINLNVSLIDFYSSILSYYFGIRENQKSNSFDFKFKGTYELICNVLKHTESKLLPLEEKLPYPILLEILKFIPKDQIQVTSMFDEEYYNYDLNQIKTYYFDKICCEFKTNNNDFYLKSFPDEIITYISFNLNENLENYLTDLGNKIDIIKIQ